MQRKEPILLKSLSRIEFYCALRLQEVCIVTYLIMTEDAVETSFSTVYFYC